MLRKIGLLLALVVLNRLMAYGQVYELYKISTTDGLPSNVVFCTLKDSKGRIWIGHEKGISKYQGKYYKHYYNDFANSPEIINLFEDESGEIHALNYAYQHFIIKNDALTLTTPLPINTFRSNVFQNQHSKTVKIGKTKNNYYIFLYKNGNTLIDSIPIAYKIGLTFYNNTITTCNDKGDFDRLTLSKPYRFKSLTNLKLICKELTTFKGATLGIGYNKNDSYYSFYYEKTNALLKTNIPVSSYITCLYNLNDSMVWVLTNKGLYVYNHSLQPLHMKGALFPAYSFSSIAPINGNIVWLSTLNKGIVVTSLTPLVQQKRTGEQIDAIVAIRNDLNVFTRTFNHYTFNASDKLFKLKAKANPSFIYEALYDSQFNRTLLLKDKIWIDNGKGWEKAIDLKAKNISMPMSGMYVLAAQSGSGLSFLLDRSIAQNPVLNYTDLTKSNIKLPLSWGLDFYTFNRLSNKNERKKDAVYLPKLNLFYEATPFGLYCLSPKGLKTLYFKSKPIVASDLAVKNDTLLIATFRQGVLMVVNNKIIELLPATHFASKYIQLIHLLDNTLWICNESLLYNYDFGTKQLIYCPTPSNVAKLDFTDIAKYNGEIYASVSDQLFSVFNTQKAQKELKRYPIFLNTLQVNNKSIPLPKGSFILDHNEENINFGVDFPVFDAENTQLSYQLNNQPWERLPENTRNILLQSLASGNYTLTLKATSPTTTYQPLVIRFAIKKPFWNTLSFYLCISLLGSITVIIYYRILIQKAAIKNNLLREKDALEMALNRSTLATIKSQMNPHFIFNALNTIQSYIYLNDKNAASSYLSQFSKLTRMILEMSNTDNVNLSQEIEALSLYLSLEKMRFPDKFEYNIVVDPELTTELIRIPAMLVQPYVENAIKHGLLHKKDDRMLKCSFTLDEPYLVIQIDDNGIGREKAQALKNKKSAHKSFSTRANEKRLALINQNQENTISIAIIDKKDSYGIPTGTLVVLKLAYKNLL